MKHFVLVLLQRRYSRCRSTYPRYCKAICSRRIEDQQCCSGFYGSACVPCPGGFRSPCSGRGKCGEGRTGSGRCKCTSKYTGTICENCRDPNKFGPFCNQTCTCLNGLCDNGPEGSGVCRKNSCKRGYFSENCDQKAVLCGPRTITCHAHSFCYVGANNTYR
ncbi:hypothetical protein EGW08_015212 [Elysia chlorotica]|uniref:EGF-like domain-containing protein n=1 Tax=Elysia chlorotica TaxID=188477 RepID=A0A3S0ZEF6_ELYCH|nr:hypothetical protein EGW08_015212 [Elysia chlorotica]